MKQLPHAKAEQRKIKWLFEVFKCKFALFSEFAGAVLKTTRFISTDLSQNWKIPQNKKTDFENETGIGHVQWDSSNKPSNAGVVSYQFHKCDVLKLLKNSFETKQTPRGNAKC